MRLRHVYLAKDDLLRERNAILEEFKEWIEKGCQSQSIICLIKFTK